MPALLARSLRTVPFLLAAACLLPACVPPPLPPAMSSPPRSIVVDTDMAIDDWLALLYLLQHPGVRVEAITVTGAGEAHCEPGVRHARGLVALAGHPAVPVACGRETPLRGAHTFPDAWRTMVDGLLGLPLPEPEAAPTEEPAPDLLRRVVRGASRPVHLLALGPLTNVAEALLADPALADELAMITIMGGAVRVPGNVGSSSDLDNDAAEWNLYVDPYAASVVFQSGVPVTLVPLDATNHALLTRAFYERLAGDHTTPAATFVYDVLSRMGDFIDSGGYYFWDPLAAALALDESLGTYETLSVRVIEAEGRESGRTHEHPGGTPVRVALTADRARFETHFLDVLNGRGSP